MSSAELTAVLEQADGQLTLSRDGGIVTVALDRPDKRNAISYAMWLALSRLMPLLVTDDSVDMVVLRGSPGGPFSSGADIGEFASRRSDPEGAWRYDEAVEPGEQAVIGCPKPTIALIEGFAIGGGIQLALACDTAGV